MVFNVAGVNVTVHYFLFICTLKAKYGLYYPVYYFYYFLGAHVRAVFLPLSPASTLVCICCFHLPNFCFPFVFSLIFCACK